MKKITTFSFILLCTLNGMTQSSFAIHEPKDSIQMVNSFDVLYVVNNDRIPLGKNPLNDLNPACVSKIRIMQIEDAAAIYGKDGQNGAVLITIKKRYKKYYCRWKREHI